MTVEASADDRPNRWAFGVAVLIGWSLIAFGTWSALRDARDAHPFALLVHVVAFDLAHDVFVAPALFAGAWLLGKALPSVARGPVRFAAAATLLVLVFTYPLVRRWGQRPTNSSTLPLAYGRNVVIVLGIVWVAAAVTIAVRMRASRRDAGGATE